MKNLCFILLALALFSCKKDDKGETIEIIAPEKISVLMNDSLDLKSIITGDSIKFSLANQLIASGTTFLWTLNGATPNTSTAAIPKVKYKTEGIYDVKLIITRGTKSDTLFIPKLVKVESTITKGLLAYYPFNGNSKDMSGNGHDGTSLDAVLTTDRFGNQSSAYLFNGVTSAIKVSDQTDLRLSQTNFTINLWVKLDSYNEFNGSALMIKRFTGVNNGWATSITGKTGGPKVDNKIGCVYYTVSGGNDPYGFAKKSLQIDTWDMVTMTYNLQNKTMSVYIDGILDTVTPNFPSPNGNCNADLFIGADNFNTGSTGYHLKGKMDDIGFYNRMLSEEEIKRIYFNSKVATPPVFDK